MIANAHASAARLRARTLIQLLAAAALTASLAALPIGIGAPGAQARVAARSVATTTATASAASVRYALMSARRDLKSTRRELSQAESTLRHTRFALSRCLADHRRCASARTAAVDARAEVTRLRRRTRTEAKKVSRAREARATRMLRLRERKPRHRHSGPPEEPPTKEASGSTSKEASKSPAKETSGSTTKESATKEGSATGEGSTPSGGESSPPREEGSTTSFEAGLDSGTNLELDVEGAQALKAGLVRIEFPVGDTPKQMAPVISAYAQAGIRVLPLAGFYGSMPTQQQARGLAEWASAFGPGGSFWVGRSDGNLAIRDIELGNETSYGYQYEDNAGEPSYQARARTYATRVKEAAEAIGATSHHVGILAQEDDWTGDWANGMFEAVPNLGSYVAGWTIHPYGPEWQGRIRDLVKQTASHGAAASIPIDVTEWGLATDNGRCLGDNYGWNPCMTYEEAAGALNSTVDEMRHTLGSRLGMFILYQVRDQQRSGSTNEREAYFGALQHELQPKGAFTAAAEHLLASK